MSTPSWVVAGKFNPEIIYCIKDHPYVAHIECDDCSYLTRNDICCFRSRVCNFKLIFNFRNYMEI